MLEANKLSSYQDGRSAYLPAQRSCEYPLRTIWRLGARPGRVQDAFRGLYDRSGHVARSRLGVTLVEGAIGLAAPRDVVPHYGGDGYWRQLHTVVVALVKKTMSRQQESLVEASGPGPHDRVWRSVRQRMDELRVHALWDRLRHA